MNYITEKLYERIMGQIEKTGKLPWQCPFIKDGFPYNYVSGQTYRGRNFLMLLCANYNNGAFLTFLQAKKLGGNVKKGEQGLPIMHAQGDRVIEGENGEKTTIKGYAKIYYVFNVSQIENLPDFDKRKEKGENKTINEFLENIPVEIETGKNASYYVRKEKISMPFLSDFKGGENEYYSALFHELIHWTGGETRLNRKIENTENMGNSGYAYEELVAELGSALLRAQFKIETPENFDNSARYLEGWCKKLREDKDMIFLAMGDAEKAVKYLNEFSDGKNIFSQTNETKIYA